MFGIGGTELLVILLVALLVFGPAKLPELARTLGKALGEFRRMSTDFQRNLNTEIAFDENQKRENTPAAPQEQAAQPSSSGAAEHTAAPETNPEMPEAPDALTGGAPGMQASADTDRTGAA